MANYPSELKYSKEHEWLKTEGETITIGISEYATEQLGDIVHVELPQPGDEFGVGDAFCVVESVKSVSDIYMPVTGKITEVNELISDNPGIINDDCYGEGWIIKVATENKSELEKLMASEAYEAFIAEES